MKTTNRREDLMIQKAQFSIIQLYGKGWAMLPSLQQAQIFRSEIWNQVQSSINMGDSIDLPYLVSLVQKIGTCKEDYEIDLSHLASLDQKSDPTEA